jgi:hypothetical protein
MSLLEAATKHPQHLFWAADVSLLDPLVAERRCFLGHRQVTDAYLLALAVHNDGCLATFDGSISLQLVPGATAAHLITL